MRVGGGGGRPPRPASAFTLPLPRAVGTCTVMGLAGGRHERVRSLAGRIHRGPHTRVEGRHVRKHPATATAPRCHPHGVGVGVGAPPLPVACGGRRRVRALGASRVATPSSCIPKPSVHAHEPPLSAHAVPGLRAGERAKGGEVVHPTPAPAPAPVRRVHVRRVHVRRVCVRVGVHASHRAGRGRRPWAACGEAVVIAEQHRLQQRRVGAGGGLVAQAGERRRVCVTPRATAPTPTSAHTATATAVVWQGACLPGRLWWPCATPTGMERL